MALQARYEPREDRMRLTLQPAQGEPRVFWVTRRQWLDWLRSLLLAAEAAGAAATPEQAGAEPPKPSRPRLADADIEPQSLSAIRVRRAGESVQMAFVVHGEGAPAQAVKLTVPPDGMLRLRDLLLQQAERAGWDVGAALARLDASALAGAAVRKASRSA